MEFNNPTNRAKGILQDINFLCGTTTATYPLADIVRNVNQAYLDVTRLIWDSADGWQYDDSNYTSLPIATTTLVHNQQDYELPSIAQRLARVEIKDGGGTYHILKQIDIADLSVASNEFLKTGGTPQYYDLIGRSLLLYPTPVSGAGGVTLVSGMKIYFDRDVNLFTTASTTAAPGFATSFHRILSFSAAIDFTQDTPQKQFWIGERARLQQGLVRFYAKRNIERSASIRPFLKKFRNTYR